MEKGGHANLTPSGGCHRRCLQTQDSGGRNTSKHSSTSFWLRVVRTRHMVVHPRKVRLVPSSERRRGCNTPQPLRIRKSWTDDAKACIRDHLPHLKPLCGTFYPVALVLPRGGRDIKAEPRSLERPGRARRSLHSFLLPSTIDFAPALPTCLLRPSLLNSGVTSHPSARASLPHPSLRRDSARSSTWLPVPRRKVPDIESDTFRLGHDHAGKRPREEKRKESNEKKRGEEE
ncbi:hypothetical protein B0T19DRAFT_31683 [Cercophora scortea]|uniref:Uncharacterized protein n=1 Tax=Cercophora scortea TaxID=314031 RepID=A0AAE0MM64_9PEZI|nr:hypothetical protein B0T19DRAFT_31683 [Cercophora scortea]